jgi:hypothetical protein
MMADAKVLIFLLLERGAIPEIRLNYFTQPEFNTAGRGKRSYRDVFEENGTRGNDIFEHSHFLSFLRYFIAGPDLPADTIDGFCEIIDEDDGHATGDTIDLLRRFVRSEIRTKGLGSNAPEEFFKLSIETGMDAQTAGRIRKEAIRA